MTIAQNFIYTFCEIFTLLLTTVHTVKSEVKILQNFVAFSEYMNFTTRYFFQLKSKQLEFLKKHIKAAKASFEKCSRQIIPKNCWINNAKIVPKNHL